MTVKDYREKHKKCAFCIHSKPMVFSGGYYCFAKEKHISFNKARKCQLYEIKEYENV